MSVDLFLDKDNTIVRTINLIRILHADSLVEHTTFRKVQPYGMNDYTLPAKEFLERYIPLTEENCPKHQLHDSGLPQCNWCGVRLEKL